MTSSAAKRSTSWRVTGIVIAILAPSCDRSIHRVAEGTGHGHLEGVVVDRSDSSPIEAATVLLKEETQDVSFISNTSNEGVVSFSSIPSGWYSVEVIYSGLRVTDRILVRENSIASEVWPLDFSRGCPGCFWSVSGKCLAIAGITDERDPFASSLPPDRQPSVLYAPCPERCCAAARSFRFEP